MDSQTKGKRATLEVENVGGIDGSKVTFDPGVTVLAGRNATNRTSLLQGLMAALGSDDVSIKGDADEARVELTVDDETYTRTLRREGRTITTSGDPYLEDVQVADLFAFLLESNEARRAVAQNADLREFIMRPVDTDDIQTEIDRLVEERQDIDRELEDIKSLTGRLPELEERRTELEDRIESKREELAAKEEELESIDVNVEQTRKEKETLETKLSELRTLRSDLEDVRYDIETERETLAELRAERNELVHQQEKLPDAPADEMSELESRIDRLRSRKQAIEPQIHDLQSIIGFNEELLDADSHDVLEALSEEADDAAITDQLLQGEEVVCWTCGTTVETDRISSTIKQLRELSQEKLTEVREIDDELKELTDRRRTLENEQDKRDQIERRLARIDEEIQESEPTIDDLQERRDELTREIAAIEEEIEEIETESYSDILDLHKEANQLEYDIGRLEGNLDSVEAEITEIESRLGDVDALEEKRSAIQEEIEDLRTRIDRIEQQAVEAFNEHMDAVLDILEYENMERIWLERVEKEVREGRRKVTKNAFHLHVVRRTMSGTTYEDTIDHLSESEREVTGLVFALAGYLTHDVAETLPFMLLDSLEAIDSERIATLIDYLSDHAEYLVVALLPEDANALAGEYHQITDI